MQLLHYIPKCIHLEWRWLFGTFRYMLIQTVWLIVKIISIPDEDLDLWPSHQKMYKALLQVIVSQLVKFGKDPMKNESEIAERR